MKTLMGPGGIGVGVAHSSVAVDYAVLRTCRHCLSHRLMMQPSSRALSSFAIHRIITSLTT